MASERKLKKQITGAISEVFTDAFLLKLFVKEEKNAEVETNPQSYSPTSRYHHCQDSLQRR